MRIQVGLIAAIIMTLAPIAAAKAENVTSFEPKTIVTALQNAGYKAKLTKDENGVSTIETAANKGTIFISFSNCTNKISCETIEFYGFWNCENYVKKCKEASDKLNNDEILAHFISKDNGKSILAYQLLIFDKIGISENLFISNFEDFIINNNEFLNLINKN
ncbi:MAG: hypothetical protein CGW95_12725 [Phenylobacterium zucineum]|nr:MAG: hypothetical protein CGW95_12725 [Phenylobacterium zucineum]